MALRASRDRVLKFVERSSHGTCRIESEAIARLVIAVPPLAEQRRIVTQVDALMALCDRLEASLRAQRAGHEAVAAAFARALAGPSAA